MLVMTRRSGPRIAAVPTDVAKLIGQPALCFEPFVSSWDKGYPAERVVEIQVGADRELACEGLLAQRRPDRGRDPGDVALIGWRQRHSHRPSRRGRHAQ